MVCVIFWDVLSG